jgi:hypothetical protein
MTVRKANLLAVFFRLLKQCSRITSWPISHVEKGEATDAWQGSDGF